MEAPLPLSTLLSQALVAFIIEFDNEFEHRVPHRTSRHGSTDGSKSAPWLLSMVMWLKLLRFIPPEGITTGALYRLTGFTKIEFRRYLIRMIKWWGYVLLGPNVPPAGPAARLVIPTAQGKQALDVWRALTGIIEERWRDRFGEKTIEQVRRSMESLLECFGVDLPDSLPLLGYHLLSYGPETKGRAAIKPADESTSEYSLPVLLSKVLLAFAFDFESELKFSLAISANVLRLVGKQGVRVRDFPRLSGVSKEAIAMATRRLETRGLAVVKSESPGNRTKTLSLTPAGRRLQTRYSELVWEIEKRWQTRCSRAAITALRSRLERMVGEPTAGRSPLFLGLEPYPDCWRASVPKPEGLPHFPMILHRGGYPDGS